MHVRTDVEWGQFAPQDIWRQRAYLCERIDDRWKVIDEDTPVARAGSSEKFRDRTLRVGLCNTGGPCVADHPSRDSCHKQNHQTGHEGLVPISCHDGECECS